MLKMGAGRWKGVPVGWKRVVVSQKRGAGDGNGCSWVETGAGGSKTGWWC